MAKKNLGRKKMPKGLAKTENINIRVTVSEHAEVDKTSKSQGMNITQWCRYLIFGGNK